MLARWRTQEQFPVEPFAPPIGEGRVDCPAAKPALIIVAAVVVYNAFCPWKCSLVRAILLYTSQRVPPMGKATPHRDSISTCCIAYSIPCPDTVTNCSMRFYAPLIARAMMFASVLYTYMRNSKCARI